MSAAPRSSDAPRVLHLVPALFGEKGVYGGAERYVFELAREMARHVPTTLATFGARSESFRHDELEVRVLGRPWRVRGQAQNPLSLGVIRMLRKADVVHCHQRILLSTLAAVWGRVTRKPVFVTDLGGGGWDLATRLPVNEWFDAHLHISRYSQQLAGEGGKMQSRVIYGGVDTEKFAPAEGIPRERAVLFVGRLLPHKGIDALIEAVPHDVPLWIVGTEADARYTSDLRRLAAGKAVEFLRGLDDERVIERYRRASCCVLPSVFRTIYGQETRVPELLGQTLLEAMACETPVICTRVASMPELVDDGETGFVVPAHDVAALREKLCWLVDHPDESRAMGRAARRAVLERFTWSKVVERCLDAYSRARES